MHLRKHCPWFYTADVVVGLNDYWIIVEHGEQLVQIEADWYHVRHTWIKYERDGRNVVWITGWLLTSVAKKVSHLCENAIIRQVLTTQYVRFVWTGRNVGEASTQKMYSISRGACFTNAPLRETVDFFWFYSPCEYSSSGIRRVSWRSECFVHRYCSIWLWKRFI